MSNELAVELEDPRSRFAIPPFKKQKLLKGTGASDEMNPQPDHGETCYQGSGKLKGLNAVITGSDSGIGRATAIAFAREGANVLVTCFENKQDAETTIELIESDGVKSGIFAGDLRQKDACKECINEAITRFGGVDIVINNAAYQESVSDPTDIDPKVFDQIFKTNVYAPFYMMQLALEHLPPGGSIINTVSIQAYRPTMEILPYAATKSALLSLTKGFAKAAMKKGIRVNAVAPGPVWTPFIPSSLELEKAQNFGADTLFGRPAQPIELAPLFVWLASPDASYVTGEVFAATGGDSPF
jgi:NAD(P)-dependent dehydrogenase (short-subunit alcohol dehydrogenase family)